jgi:hypothetical protein
MNKGNGRTGVGWGCAIEGQPTAMLQAALRTVARDGCRPEPLPVCDGDLSNWVCQVAECLRSGPCRRAVLFCADPGLACCLANKVPGVRAVVVGTVSQTIQALKGLGANLLVVERMDRTYYEYRQIIQLCRAGADCPPEVARFLQELDGHAHC